MAEPNALRISVLANGDLLLQGAPAALPDLKLAIENLAKEGGIVWYYRENAPGDPPAAVQEVLNEVVRWKLPIQLFTSPDFSAESVVRLSPLEQMFAAVRMKALEGNLVIVRPDSRPMMLPTQRMGALPPGALEAVEKILPSAVKRNVAVIGDTAWSMDLAPDLMKANEAIPFFGMLMGLGAIGHAVWIFDASAPEALEAGCRAADVLIVDSGREPGLPAGWKAMAARSMRGRDVMVHDRATYRLRKA
jgi:hypothetical protein